MKDQSQLLLIALAVAFAVALCLTVALISVGASKKEEPVTLPPERTYPALPSGTTAQTAALPAATTAAPTMRSGMVFRSNGDGTCTLESALDYREAFAVIPERSPAGEIVTAIAPRAFCGNETVAAIRIPECVTEIGAYAFADCAGLVYISVSEQNPRFCDVGGVLYSADGTELILYPPLHEGESVSIPSTVTSIADMAFYGCAYLREVCFSGSPAQWEQIRIGTKNYSLTAASVRFYAVG